MKLLPNALSGQRSRTARCVRPTLGKMRMHYIRIIPGDRVTLEMTHDLTKARPLTVINKLIAM